MTDMKPDFRRALKMLCENASRSASQAGHSIDFLKSLHLVPRSRRLDVMLICESKRYHVYNIDNIPIRLYTEFMDCTVNGSTSLPFAECVDVLSDDDLMMLLHSFVNGAYVTVENPHAKELSELISIRVAQYAALFENAARKAKLCGVFSKLPFSKLPKLQKIRDEINSLEIQARPLDIMLVSKRYSSTEELAIALELSIVQ